jgi:hypothetical protein
MRPRLKSWAKARFEIAARRGVERLARRARRLMDHFTRFAGDSLRPRGISSQLILLRAVRAFAAELGRSRRDGETGRGHAHHLIGDMIRLVLKRVIDLPDDELRLKKRMWRLMSGRRVGRKHWDLTKIPWQASPTLLRSEIVRLGGCGCLRSPRQQPERTGW